MKGLLWAPRWVIAEYDLEQRSGELLQAVVCRDSKTAAAVRVRSDASRARHCILLMRGEGCELGGGVSEWSTKSYVGSVASD
jgi:hypothetical protein